MKPYHDFKIKKRFNGEIRTCLKVLEERAAGRVDGASRKDIRTLHGHQSRSQKVGTQEANPASG